MILLSLLAPIRSSIPRNLFVAFGLFGLKILKLWQQDLVPHCFKANVVPGPVAIVLVFSGQKVQMLRIDSAVLKTELGLIKITKSYSLSFLMCNKVFFIFLVARFSSLGKCPPPPP